MGGFSSQCPAKVECPACCGFYQPESKEKEGLALTTYLQKLEKFASFYGVYMLLKGLLFLLFAASDQGCSSRLDKEA
jgi:hypothetical protein